MEHNLNKNTSNKVNEKISFPYCRMRIQNINLFPNRHKEQGRSDYRVATTLPISGNAPLSKKQSPLLEELQYIFYQYHFKIKLLK